MKVRSIIQFIKTNWVPLFNLSNFKKHIVRLPVYILVAILLVVYGIYKLLSKLIMKLYKFGHTVTYGILKPCYRCTYQKSGEMMLHFSDKRGVRIITKDNTMYVRKGGCLGIEECGKCFMQITKYDPTLPCTWKVIKSR